MTRSSYLRFYIFVVVTCLSPPLFSEGEQSPEDLVIAFITDYEQWNNEFIALSKKLDALRVMDKAEFRYKQILKKYCKADIEHEAIAFAEDPDHQSKSETIINSLPSGSFSRVTTTHTYKSGYHVNYEYLFHWDSNKKRWYLEHIYSLQPEGKIDTL